MRKRKSIYRSLPRDRAELVNISRDAPENWVQPTASPAKHFLLIFVLILRPAGSSIIFKPKIWFYVGKFQDLGIPSPLRTGHWVQSNIALCWEWKVPQCRTQPSLYTLHDEYNRGICIQYNNMMSKFLFKQKITKFDPYITKLTEAECLRISLKSALIFPLILNHNWLSSNYKGWVQWLGLSRQQWLNYLQNTNHTVKPKSFSKMKSKEL